MFEKIHNPDWSKVFAKTGEYSGKAGNALASAFVIGGKCIGLTFKAVTPLTVNAIRGVFVMAGGLFVDVGQTLKDQLGGSNGGNGCNRDSNASRSNSEEWWGRRHSA